MVQKLFWHHVFMLGDILLFPPDVEVLSRDTEEYSKAEGNTQPVKTEEDAAAEDREDNKQAGLSDQGNV